jgi:hypothetical protein
MTWFTETENIEKIEAKTFFSNYHHAEEMKADDVISYETFLKDFGHGMQRYCWDQCIVREKDNVDVKVERYFKLAALDPSQEELDQLAQFCACPNCHPPRKFFFTGMPLSVLVILALNWAIYVKFGSVASTLTLSLCIYTAFNNFRRIYGIALAIMYCACCHGCLTSDFPAQHHIRDARKKMATDLLSKVKS